MNITPVRNAIVFTFVDNVNSKGEFDVSQTTTGVLLQSSVDNSAKQPRWVNVHRVGPECTTVGPDQLALLPSLRWTLPAKWQGQRFWKSDEQEVVAVVENNQLRPLGKFIIIKQNESGIISHTTSGLILVGNVQDTPSGVVVSTGPKVQAELQGLTIYYNGTNFFDVFVFNGDTYAFIKEDDVLAYEDPTL